LAAILLQLVKAMVLPLKIARGSESSSAA